MNQSTPKPRRQRRSKKQPNQPKRKPKVRVYARTNASAVKLSSQIADSVEAILHAQDLVLPRALPTHVVPLQTSITLSISGTTGTVVEVAPNVEFPITTRSINEIDIATLLCVPSTPTVLSNVDDYVGDLINFAPDLSDGTNVLEPTTAPDSYPSSEHFIYTNVSNTLSFSADKSVPTLYQASIQSLGSQVVEIVYQSDPGANGTYDLVFTLYNNKYEIVQEFTQITAIEVGNTVSYGGFDLITISPHTSFRMWLRPRTAPVKFTTITFPLQIVSQQVLLTTKKYYPIPKTSDWIGLLSSSTRWCLTAASLTLTNTASSLVNGGNCAIALLPSGVQYPKYPTAAFDFISGLPYNKYTGPAQTGCHCSYLADDLSQYFFQPMSNQSIDGPKLVASFKTNSGNVSTDVSLQVKINMVYEFITADVTRPHVVSPGHAAYFEAMIGGILRVTDKSSLAGENPDHFAKIKEIAKKVAKDPTVRAAARAVGTAGKDLITMFGPALLGALV